MTDAKMETKTATKFGAFTDALDVVKGIDLSGKVAIVTGGAGGIGVETARALAAAGARVVIAARSAEKAKVVVEDIVKTTKNDKVDAMDLDLSSLKSVAAFAAAFKQRKLPLHLLINNAGIMACPYGKTADGFETQFGVNHLGHFFLTSLLLDVLLASEGGARVVNVSSSGHMTGNVRLEDYNWEQKGAYERFAAYSSSKTANILHASELDRRFGKQGVAGFSLHPGSVSDTALGRSFSLEEKMAMGWVDKDGNVVPGPIKYKTSPQGASTSVYVATAPELAGKGGLYFEDCAVAMSQEEAAKCTPVVDLGHGVKIQFAGQAAHSRSAETAGKLWALSVQLLKPHFEAAGEAGAAALKLVS